MSQQAAFVSSILASPCDDALRLVFADWLEEHSDPRAGCLRLASRLRAAYGPLRHTHSLAFWKSLVQGIEPGWWVEEALRLDGEVDDEVGDGRKTAILIALALAESTLLFPDSWGGVGPDALRRATAQAVEGINWMTVQPTRPDEVGRCLRTAARGNEALATTMLSAIAQGGPDSALNIVPLSASPAGQKVRMVVQQGLRFPLSGLQGEEGREVEDVAVLVSLRPLREEEIRQALAAYATRGDGLLCLCPGPNPEVANLIREGVRNGAQIILGAEPTGRWMDCFEDVAAATGSRSIAPDEPGPVAITPDELGVAGSVRIEAAQLVIGGTQGDQELRQRWTEHLRQRILESSGEEQEWHCQRIAQFTGGAVTIEVCGESPEETWHLSELSYAAMHSGRWVIAEGYVPGGGAAYLRGATGLDGPVGQALRWALEEPVRALMAGVGVDAEEILAGLRAKESLTLDVRAKELVPWRSDGPIDPARVVQTVVKCAIESAIRARDRFGY